MPNHVNNLSKQDVQGLSDLTALPVKPEQENHYKDKLIPKKNEDPTNIPPPQKHKVDFDNVMEIDKIILRLLLELKKMDRTLQQEYFGKHIEKRREATKDHLKYWGLIIGITAGIAEAAAGGVKLIPTQKKFIKALVPFFTLIGGVGGPTAKFVGGSYRDSKMEHLRTFADTWKQLADGSQSRKHGYDQDRSKLEQLISNLMSKRNEVTKVINS